MNKIIKLYGIPNCDTVKKARVWLTQNGIDYQFHDFKTHGVSDALLESWLKQVGWQKLLKKTGKTWACELNPEQKASIQDDASAQILMLQFRNLIKRPVLESDGRILALGFKEAEYQNLAQELKLQ